MVSHKSRTLDILLGFSPHSTVAMEISLMDHLPQTVVLPPIFFSSHLAIVFAESWL
jgi:hypothetical protein